MPKYEVINSHEQPPWGVCFAIYGKPGIGKTTEACNLAGSEYGAPLWMADCEGGARAIEHRDDIKIVPITDKKNNGFELLLELVNDLVSDKLDPKTGTFLVDNMSEVVSLALNYILRTTSRQIPMSQRPDQQDWGKVNNELLAITRKLRDHARVSGTNVIFVAWETPHEDAVTAVKKRDLAFNPAFARAFPGMIDIVGLITIAGIKPGQRKISFKPSDTTAAKFRRGRKEGAILVPDEIQYDMTHHVLVDVVATLKGGKPWPVDKYMRAATPAT